MFEEKNFSLSDSYELCLEFCESGLSCGYYIADHSTRCIFWLDPVSTEDLEMNPAFSLEHLREHFAFVTAPLNSRSSDRVSLISGYASEGMYWSHVEFYPSHKGASTNGLVLNLMRTLAHAQGGASERNRSQSLFFETHFRCTHLLRFYFPLFCGGKRAVHETDQAIHQPARRWPHPMFCRSFEQLHRCACPIFVKWANERGSLTSFPKQSRTNSTSTMASHMAVCREIKASSMRTLFAPIGRHPPCPESCSVCPPRLWIGLKAFTSMRWYIPTISGISLRAARKRDFCS